MHFEEKFVENLRICFVEAWKTCIVQLIFQSQKEIFDLCPFIMALLTGANTCK